MGCKGKELSTAVRNLIAASYQMNGNVSNLARTLSLPRFTIKSVLKNIVSMDELKIVREEAGRNFTDRDMNQLSCVVKENRRRTFRDITGIFNESRERPFSAKTVEKKIHELGYKRRVAKKTVAVREVNKKKHVKWCKERKKLDWQSVA